MSSRNLKLVILGDSSVGKTSLMRRFVNNDFSNAYKATIGLDFLNKSVLVRETNEDGTEGPETKVQLAIWDTAGQESFSQISVASLRGADACMLVFDLSRPSTVDSLNRWRSSLDDALCIGDGDDDSEMESDGEGGERERIPFPLVVIANKVDDIESTRIVKPLLVRAQGALSDARHIVEVFAASAKAGDGVDTAFERAALLGLKRQRELNQSNE
ncbi:small GTPase superfamily, Rho type, partial [Kipferlia bialata]|eukprot:g4563.t1